MALLVLLLSLAIPPNQSRANEICFEEDIAKQILVDLKSNKEKVKMLEDIQLLFDKEINIDGEAIQNLSARFSLMEEQLASCEERGNGYKIEWQKCGDTLAKCENNKPSRWTWFSMGAGSGLGIALILILL